MDNVIDLLKVCIEKDYSISITTSPYLILAIIILTLSIFMFYKKIKKYKVQKLNINLGNIGSVEIQPNASDLQIAHRIWTELVTRKAAIKIDKNNDVIIEVYESWYELFKQVRLLISEIPAELIKNHESTRKIVEISINTLNDGLRPHLTKWQARYRTWYNECSNKNTKKSPQELQRDFPEFNELFNDMLLVNENLIQYAGELKKLLN